MVYTSNSIFHENKIMIVGYTRPTGAIVKVDDLFESRLAFSELCSILQQQPIINSTTLEDGSVFLELDLEANIPGVTQSMDIFNPNGEIESVLAPAVTTFADRFESLKINATFERIGVICPALAAKIRQVDESHQARMTSPEDDINFSVPTYAEVRAVYGEHKVLDVDEETGEVMESLDSDKTAVFNPEDTLELPDLIPGYESLNPQINFGNIPVKRLFPYIDSVAYEDALRMMGNPIPVTYIIGNPQNNMLGIQPNEMRYYEALKNLIIEGIMIENNVVTRDEVEALMAQGKRSKIVDQYLADLAADAFAVNWTHTGMVLNTIESEVTDDDDDDSQGNVEIGVAYPGYYRVDFKDGELITTMLVETCRKKFTEGSFIEGITRIRHYCNNQIFNSFAWAEALIRLLRWGDRKPSCLCIKSFDNSKPEYLDLNTMTLTPFAGNVEDLVPVYIDQDNNITQRIYGVATISPEGFSNPSLIKDTFEVSLDKDKPIPVGIMLRTDYVSQNIFKIDVVDIETFITMVSAGAIRLKGVSFDKETNTFSVSPEAQDQVAAYFDAEEVLSGNLKDIIINTIQNPSIVRTLQVISSRFKDVRLQEINTFTVWSEFLKLENVDHMYSAMNIVNIAKEEERNAEMAKLRQRTALTAARVIKLSLIEQLCIPYLDLTDEVDDVCDIEPLLNKMFKVISTRNTSGSRRAKMPLKVNPKFTAYVGSCGRHFALRHPISGDAICYVGELNKGTKEINGKTIPINFYFFWKPEEFKAPTNSTNITGPAFVQSFLRPYTTQKEALVDKRFFLATPSTLTDVYITLRKIEEELK